MPGHAHTQKQRHVAELYLCNDDFEYVHVGLPKNCRSA